jgi:hypothetical protein
MRIVKKLLRALAAAVAARLFQNGTLRWWRGLRRTG